ncbi:hypothetical protein J3E69DRAFT_94770 [Trichoderma sp. SZMC 28015]
MSTYLVRLMEDTPTQSPSAQICSTHINDHGALLNEAHCSSLGEGMSDFIPGLVHSDASTVVSSIKSLGTDAGNIGISNGKAIKEASDDKCSFLGLSGSVDDEEIFHHDNSLKLNDDGDQAEGVSWAMKPDNTATATQASKVFYKSCATQARACAEVPIGFGDQTPRWRRGSELSYVICKESFLTEDIAMLVEVAMRTAISMWKDIGVLFRPVDRHDEATFAVVYEDLSEGAYAASSFPRASGGKLILSEPSLSNTDYLVNILAHEVGHILGLRHGFVAYDEGELSISDIDPNTGTSSLPSNSDLVSPANSAAISATHISPCPFLNRLDVKPAKLYRAGILISIFYMLFIPFILLVALILILFVHLILMLFFYLKRTIFFFVRSF